MTTPARQIRSTLTQEGRMIVEVADVTLPDPKAKQVVVAVEAAPVNPSDIAGLFGPALLDKADYAPGRIDAPVPEAALRAQAGRIGQPTLIGIECAGTVVAAGDDPAAQALLGRKVSAWPGAGTFASHVVAPAAACIALPDDANMANASAAFVNPMTALGFVGTMKREGYQAILHTASASNLGQMLNRICQEDGIPIVNVVRKAEQVDLLKRNGAKIVLNSSDRDFLDRLIAAIAETRAYCGFDAIGGGDMAGTILFAMEQAANRDAEYSRYGSSQRKHLYIYGRLDTAPMTLPPTIGFSWDLSAWLLFPYLQEVGADVAQAMRDRVIAGLDTTFASNFAQRVTLGGLLDRDAALRISARRTGEKFLITPAA